jgi:hypothetical protein
MSERPAPPPAIGDPPCAVRVGRVDLPFWRVAALLLV